MIRVKDRKTSNNGYNQGYRSECRENGSSVVRQAATVWTSDGSLLRMSSLS